MEAETWHLPEYRCLAPPLRHVTEPHWLHSPQCEVEQRFLCGDGPAQVGFGSFEPHRLCVYTERSVPATHANIEHRTLNVQHRIMYSANLKKTELSANTFRNSIRLSRSTLSFSTKSS